ncbi:MAG: VWA domain-containing protein [Planctomycetes bacterium]|nr:VWA domain-containing protein [Planctomycetota bacterium]
MKNTTPQRKPIGRWIAWISFALVICVAAAALAVPVVRRMQDGQDFGEAFAGTLARMPVTFASPEFLLGLLLLPIVILLGRKSLAGLDRVRRRMAVGLRLALVTLLVLALAEVEWRDLTQRVEVIYVVDHSRSIPEGKSQEVLDLINKSRGRMDPRIDLGKIVVFGREGYNEATLRRDGAPLTRYASDIDRDYSNLEEGISRALEALEPNARGRIVLLSDGNQTAGDVKNAIAKAREAGVPIDVVPIEYSYNEEVLVEKIKIPEEAKIGEPFLARVVIRAAEDTEAKVHLWRDGALIETRPVLLKRGVNVEKFQLELDEAGFFRVEAVVQIVGKQKDHLFQNNTAHGFVFARGKAQVLYVHDEADPEASEAHHFLLALKAAEIRVKVIPATDFPLKVGELQGFDAVILDDVARPAFSDKQLKNIETAVADMGIGLIMIGGARGFGAGEWRNTPVEKALPLEMDIKQEQVIPDGALALVIHSCEMAEGNAMAINVCQKAVDNLSAKDTIGVLVYGQKGSMWAVKPTKARNKRQIKAKIRQMQVGDMPDFDPIFSLAVTALEKLPSAVKHMIVMSDGDPSQPRASLLKRCRKARITVSTICYFAHGGAQGPSVDLMKRIANVTGGKYYYLDDAKKLPQIFLKESKRVTRSLIVNKTIVPAIRGQSPVLAGFDGFPELTGYVLTEAKPRAEVALTAPDGSPILAHWQYGVGKTLAFTSDAKPRWATEWVAWEGFQPFWSQAVRWVKKDVQESVFKVSTTLKGDQGQIVVDAISEDGETVSGLNVRAKVSSPDPKEPTREIQLVQQGAGRYVARFPVTKVGTYSVSLLSLDAEGQRRHSVTTGLVVPYSDEFKRLKSDRTFLEEIAKLGGGKIVEPEQLATFEINPWRREDLGEREALEERWSFALALALLLFFIDVATRRVAIDWDKLIARAKAVVTRKETPRTIDRLRERKARVQQAREETLHKFTAEPGVDHGPVDVAGAGSVGGPGGDQGQDRPRPKPKPKPKPTADGAAEGGYTNRLLEAKRRARRELDEGKDRG